MGDDLDFEPENLQERTETILKVLKSTSETFEKHFDDSFTRDDPSLALYTLPDLRLDSLEKFIVALRSALKLTSPFVEEANEVVTKLNGLTAKVDLIRDKMKSINVSKDFLQLCTLEKLIHENHAKLKCAQKLERHLKPTPPELLELDLEDDDHEGFTRIIHSAESLKQSRQFCHFLKKFDNVSDSSALSASMEQIDDDFERVAQMCYFWLSARTRKISQLSLRFASDSGIINDPLINVPYTEDKAGVVSIFETSFAPGVDSREYSPSANTSRAPSESGEDAHQGNLSLRILKILILSPRNLELFLTNTNEFLAELAVRRFESLLHFIKLDSKFKNNLIYDVFMNLQLVLTLVKSCVISLYTNCELDLYKNPYPEFDILNVPDYIDRITGRLVLPLERKLDDILSSSTPTTPRQGSIASLDSLPSLRSFESTRSLVTSPEEQSEPPEEAEGIFVADILDLYAALQICNFYYNKISNLLKPPYLHPYSTVVSEAVEGLDYQVDRTPILESFTKMSEQWNNMIVNKLQQNITLPLSDENKSKKLSPQPVVSTVSRFLGEIVSIQLEYSTSDDLLAILQMTLNPVINWLEKVSKDLGRNPHLFLIASYSTLLNSIQSPFVNNSFKSLLEDLINTNVDAVAKPLVLSVIEKFGGQLREYSPLSVEFTDEDFLENLRNLVYTDQLGGYLPPELAEDLTNSASTSCRRVFRRVYTVLATLYKEHSQDSEKAADLLALASSY